MLFKKITLLLSLCLFCTFAVSAEPVTILAGSADFHSPEQITKEEWEAAIPPEQRQNITRIKMEHIRETAYARIQINNIDERSRWILESMDKLAWLDINIYSELHKTWISDKSGDHVPMVERKLPHSSTIMPLPLDSHGKQTLYLRYMVFQYPGIKLRIVEPGKFLYSAGHRDAFMLFVFGLIFIAALYNFILYLTGNTRAYLYYGLFMIFFLVSLLGKYRYLNFLFFPEQPYGYFVYIFFNSLAVAAAMHFCVAFFQFSLKSIPAFIFLGVSTVLGIIAVISLFTATPALGNIMNAIIIPSLVFILIITVRRAFTGDRASRIMLLSIIPLLIAVLIDNAAVYLMFPRGIFRDFYQIIGIVFHILLMNFGLAIRQSETSRALGRLKQNFQTSLARLVKDRTKELERKAYRDALTGLLNRKALDQTVLEIKEDGQGPLAIVFADMDNFKFYNDNYGHATGDLILKETAHFLSSGVRYSDMVFRYGGDEFLILMPHTLAGTAESLVERLHEGYQSLSKRINDDLFNQEGGLGLSLGISHWDSGKAYDLWKAIHLADEALLKAKRDGKNRILVSSL